MRRLDLVVKVGAGPAGASPGAGNIGRCAVEDDTLPGEGDMLFEDLKTAPSLQWEDAGFKKAREDILAGEVAHSRT